MTDFMRWFYANYIRPQLGRIPREAYQYWISALENDLMPCQKEDYEKTLEFYAVHAFLLGVETGRGLSEALSPTRPA